MGRHSALPSSAGTRELGLTLRAASGRSGLTVRSGLVPLAKVWGTRSWSSTAATTPKPPWPPCASAPTASVAPTKSESGAPSFA
eukprot:9680697-Alexandrium_andersonii.AAC.1